MYDLKSLGWNEFFEGEFQVYKGQGCSAARVALEHRNQYRLYSESGEITARAAGKLRFDSRTAADMPAVGDWVCVSGSSADNVQIQAVLPRRSKFSRKAAGANPKEQVVAANVDTVFLVQGLDHDFNLRRLERYLVAAFESKANPVIILNKVDLCEEPSEKLAQVESVAPAIAVHAVSSIDGRGLDQLDQYVGAGLTIAFLGSSGVGKSTLINRLIGEEVQKTAMVREHDSRGRHATTHRELIVLKSGGLLIDTPGMRELHLWDAGNSLSNAFADIESIAANCYFRDCRHQSEPGCAVRQALQEGSLDASRFENFAKMDRELEYLDSRMDEKLHLKRKHREKKIHRAYRTIKNRRT